MTRRSVFLVHCFFLALANNALSETLFVQIFLDQAPLSGITVMVDGDEVGRSQNDGVLSVDLEPGEYEIELVDDDVAFPFDVAIEESAETEASVTFYSEEGIAPAVSVGLFSESSLDVGFVVGQVTDSDGTPLEGASVDVGGVSVVLTGSDGLYSIEVPRGVYSINVQHPEFKSAQIDSVRIFANVGVNASFSLKTEDELSLASAEGVLEEVVVVGVFRPDDSAEGLERYASTIVSAIDADQISRFGDSDVAAVLGRIVGLSVTEGKYANVRGLDGRYVSANFNGLLMPSTDPMRRDIQLDLFPSNIVESIEVQKSFSVDQLASTTGGSIRVATKGLPDERAGTVSVSAGYNTEVTGNDVLGYRDSTTEWLGYDNGLRALHAGVLEATDYATSLTICKPRVADICTHPGVAAAYAMAFKPDYDTQDISADPDVGVDFDFGDRIELKDGELGYYLAGGYSRGTDDRGSAQLRDPTDLSGGYSRSKDMVTVTGYGVIGYEYGAGNEVLSKTTLLRSTEDVTRRSIAIDSEDVDVDTTILEYVQRQLFSQVFTGVNEFQGFGVDSAVNWRVGYAETDRLEPDRRTFMLRNGSLSTTSVERRWSDLNETSSDIGVDYAGTLDWGGANTSTVLLGAMWSDKERTVDLYRFGIRQGDARNISLIPIDGVDQLLAVESFAADYFRLRPSTTPTDSYVSTEELFAYYAALRSDFGSDWSVEVGGRFESFTQSLFYPNDAVAGDFGAGLESDGWYPALNVSWRASESIQIRLGYSDTVSYPGLVERSRSASFDPITDDPIFGNPNLVTSDISNIDLRMEYYFGQSNRLSIAAFNKKIDNPVELAIPDASGSAASGVTFRNQTDAQLDGIELDFNTKIYDRDGHSLFINGNYSFIDSSVTLGADSLRLEGAVANGRQLQGQSEYLANLQVGYDHQPSGQKVTLLVNYFDDRIFRVARGAASGAIVEVGRTLIDLNYEKLFADHWTFNLKIKNLGNEKTSFIQNTNEIEFYESGTSIGATLSYKL